jgi:lysophospholipase L1-like esterase
MKPLRIFAALAIVCATLTVSARSPASAEPLRILPLGDSITQGNVSTRSYRYNLWRKLTDARIDFDFVGTLNTNVDGKNPPWPDYAGKTFDRDHEGRWGWYTDLFLQKENLPAWLRKYTPDIVLLHLGTNDVFRESGTGETVTKLRKIIELLQADNPRVTILLAKLIGSTSKRNPQIQELNAEMQTLAAAASTQTSRVVVVDHNTGFDFTPGVDTYDGTHPNAAGEEKMAQRWFDAIIKVVNALPASR